jgi:hypothetical protein
VEFTPPNLIDDAAAHERWTSEERAKWEHEGLARFRDALGVERIQLHDGNPRFLGAYGSPHHSLVYQDLDESEAKPILRALHRLGQAFFAKGH